MLLAVVSGACDFLPGRDIDPDFEITGQVPTFTLALGDSVIIDMSNYWRFTDEDYAGIDPPIIQARPDSNLFTLRSVGTNLIVKGTETGRASISVRSKARSWADQCNPYYLTDPLTFQVRVDSTADTSVDFGNSIEGVKRNRIKMVKVEPPTFAEQDTVRVRPAPQNTVDEATWSIFDGRNLEPIPCTPISTQSEEIRVRIEDSSRGVSGYVLVEDSSVKVDEHTYYSFRKEGLYFHMPVPRDSP